MGRTFLLYCPFGISSGEPLKFDTIADLLEIPAIRREVEAQPPTSQEIQEEQLLKEESLPASLAAFEKLADELREGDEWKRKPTPTDWIDMGAISLKRPSEADYDFFSHRCTHTFLELIQTKDAYAICGREGKWRHLYSIWFDDNGYRKDFLLGYFNGEGPLENVAKHDLL